MAYIDNDLKILQIINYLYFWQNREACPSDSHAGASTLPFAQNVLSFR